VDRKEQSPEERMIEDELTVGVGEAFEELNEQQQTVIEYRFGLHGQPCLTLQETGERMGLSRERVRQIECQAKECIRKSLQRRTRFRPPSVRPVPTRSRARRQPEIRAAAS
jgi:RNA polymerase sigma factor (sigma-70 family)